jgi:hypothetical protein
MVYEPRLAFTKFISVTRKEVGAALLLMLLHLLIRLAIGL